MILYLTAGLFGGYNETIKFEELGISTHSLTRRLTPWNLLLLKSPVIFQLTASQGGWRKVNVSENTPAAISTHSLTRRLTYNHCQLSIIILFQLTASQGGWPQYQEWILSAQAFQLTASQGGWRTTGVGGLMAYAIFQLTASQGGWRCKGRHSTESIFHFNSQPHKEADSESGRHYMTHLYFNSQPHKEADSPTTAVTNPVWVFQLTASQGGWLVKSEDDS